MTISEPQESTNALKLHAERTTPDDNGVYPIVGWAQLAPSREYRGGDFVCILYYTLLAAAAAAGKNITECLAYVLWSKITIYIINSFV